MVVEPMATPYRAIIHLDKTEIQKELDDFWKEYGEILVKNSNYKGKKSKGGKVDLKKARQVMESTQGLSTLYGPPLANWANTYIDKNYQDLSEKVLYVNRVKLEKWDSEEPYLIAWFYFWPKLNFFDKLDFKIKRQIPRDLDKAIEGRLKDLQNQNKVYKTIDHDDWTDQMEVNLDIITSLNGEPYEEGTLRKKWLKLENIVSQPLRDAIHKHKLGDLFETSFENPFKTPKEGEEPEIIDATVKIYGVRLGEVLDLEDPKLYESAKVESKEEFIEKFTQEYNKYMDDSERQYAFDEIMNQLTMNGKLEAIPQNWIDLNTENFMKMHIKQMGDLQKAKKAVGASNDQNYRQMVESQVIKDTVSRMAVRAYSAMYNVPEDPEVVSYHINSQVEWIDNPA